MTDTQRLNAIIKERGIKKKNLASRMNLSPYGLARKISGDSEFKASEVTKLCEILGIKTMTDKYNIFFKQ